MYRAQFQLLYSFTPCELLFKRSAVQSLSGTLELPRDVFEPQELPHDVYEP